MNARRITLAQLITLHRAFDNKITYKDVEDLYSAPGVSLQSLYKLGYLNKAKRGDNELAKFSTSAKGFRLYIAAEKIVEEILHDEKPTEGN